LGAFFNHVNEHKLIACQQELAAKGFIYKGKHEGWYSITDECFYTRSQIKRVETEMGEERWVSIETGSRVEWTEEENYMFRLSSFRESLLVHFQNNPESIYPPQFHSEIVASLQGELQDLSISRPKSRLHWGIPVPDDKEHTVYVWFDALISYLSATGYPWATSESAGKKAFFPPNLQVIGKDILR
jgi:methionyl-tRNA synthetase